MKKFFLFSIVLIVIIVSFKLSKDDEFVVSEDYYDTIRKITIHAHELKCEMATRMSGMELSPRRASVRDTPYAPRRTRSEGTQKYVCI